MFKIFNAKYQQKIKTSQVAYYELINYALMSIELDDESKIINANENFLIKIHTSLDQLEGKFFLSCVNKSKILERENKKFLDNLKFKERFKGDVKLNFFGTTLELYAIMIHLPKENTIKTLITFVDNSNFYKQKKEILKIIFFDRLTNLGNRDKLMSDLSLVNQKKSTFIIINIKHFRNINYIFGYEVGDLLLKKIAEYLNDNLLRSNSLLYRITSDKFAILMNEKLSKDSLIDYIKELITKLSNAVFVIYDNKITITISIGASIGGENILKYAEDALYTSSINLLDYTIYDDNNIKTSQKTIITEVLKEALETNMIIPYFQPIINSHTNEIEKYEILMRIMDKMGKIYLPNDFLSIARRAELYTNLVQIMLPKAFKYSKLTNYSFTLNLFIDDFFNPLISEFLKKNIKEYDIGNRLILEVVNISQIKDFPNLLKQFDNYKALGCKIAIDDFGSNSEEFKKLLNLNIDYIKINKKFIEKINENIIKKLLFITKKAKIKTVAEFVDNSLVYDKVKELNIDYIQGYYISPPNQLVIQDEKNNKGEL